MSDWTVRSRFWMREVDEPGGLVLGYGATTRNAFGGALSALSSLPAELP